MTDWADEKAQTILGPEWDEDAFWRGMRDDFAQALRDAVAVEREACAQRGFCEAKRQLIAVGDKGEQQYSAKAALVACAIREQQN